MFLGEFTCLILYGIKRMVLPTPVDNCPALNPIWIAVPAIFDICGSSLMFVALTMTAASIYQMMRGVIVVITALLAIKFLGKRQYAHHYLSLVSIVFGVFIVGLVGVMHSDKCATTS